MEILMILPIIIGFIFIMVYAGRACDEQIILDHRCIKCKKDFKAPLNENVYLYCEECEK